MTRLLLIHGIGQQEATEEALHQSWVTLLSRDASPALREKIDDAQPEMAFYAAQLAEWTTAATAMGAAAAAAEEAVSDPDERDFLVKGLAEMATRQGLGQPDIVNAEHQTLQELGVAARPMSTAFGRRIVALVRAIENLSPWKGDIALRVLRQAYAYLKKPGVGRDVDAVVRPRLGNEPTVIVAHSLGTVIAYRLLKESAAGARQVPLLVTLGSPLALTTVKAVLGPGLSVPPVVERWLNLYDPGDPVTLGKPLDAANFCGGIDNVGDVNNTTFNAHGIGGYLPDERVRAALGTVL